MSRYRVLSGAIQITQRYIYISYRSPRDIYVANPVFLPRACVFSFSVSDMTRSCSSDIFASDKRYPFLELTTPEKYFEAIAGKYPYRIVPLSHTPLCIHTHTLLSLLTILPFARLLVLRIRIFRHWPFNNNNNSFIITLNKGEFLQSFSQKKKKEEIFT